MSIRAGAYLAGLDYSIDQRSLKQETCNVRLNHGTNQHARELGLRADSLGDVWAHPCDLQFQLVHLDLGEVTRTIMGPRHSWVQGLSKAWVGLGCSTHRHTTLHVTKE